MTFPTAMRSCARAVSHAHTHTCMHTTLSPPLQEKKKAPAIPTLKGAKLAVAPPPAAGAAAGVAAAGAAGSARPSPQTAPGLALQGGTKPAAGAGAPPWLLAQHACDACLSPWESAAGPGMCHIVAPLHAADLEVLPATAGNAGPDLQQAKFKPGQKALFLPPTARCGLALALICGRGWGEQLLCTRWLRPGTVTGAW